MTFQQLMLECIDLHFDTDDVKPATVKRWINLAEMELWNSADWVFKRQAVANLTVVAGVATEPADFGKVHRIYDSQGAQLNYLEPDVFESSYSVGSVQAGPGAEYTVINRQIVIGPADTATYKVAYRRRYAHLNAASAVVAGTMTLPDDTPIWDSEFHYVLVPWAMLLGGTLTDQVAFARGHVFSYASVFEQQRDEALQAMKGELLTGEEGETQVWGELSWL